MNIDTTLGLRNRNIAASLCRAESHIRTGMFITAKSKVTVENQTSSGLASSCPN
jgi:hypothetical protein